MTEQVIQSTFRIVRLYISDGHNFVGHHGRCPGTHPAREVPQIRCVAGRGVEGDRYFDFKEDFKGQITFFSHEVYRDLCQSLGVRDKPASVFRRNVITGDVDLNDLIGVTFEVQGIRFHGTEECRPCYWMDQAFGPGAERALQGRGGLRARILSNGLLQAIQPLTDC